MAAVTALACGGDSSGPGSSPVGSYGLSTYNGKPLPATVFSDTGFSLAISAGSLALASDGGFLVTLTTRETVEGHLSVYVDSSTGRWTQSGSSVVLTGADSVKLPATWDGARLTLTDTTSIPPSTYLFTKQ